MKPKYSTLLLLLATIGCKQEVMAQVKPGYCAASPDSQYCIPRGAMMSTDDTTVVRMTTEEYSNLQKLRQAVVDEEKRLAVKYGAEERCSSMFHTCWGDPDHYTFHGQFLLIDKAEQYVYGITGTLSPESLKKFGPPDNAIILKPKQWSAGISPSVEDWIKKHSDSDQTPLILNRFPDGSVLKGAK